MHQQAVAELVFLAHRLALANAIQHPLPPLGFHEVKEILQLRKLDEVRLLGYVVLDVRHVQTLRKGRTANGIVANQIGVLGIEWYDLAGNQAVVGIFECSSFQEFAVVVIGFDGKNALALAHGVGDYVD